MRIAVLGNVNADVSYAVHRLPHPGETLLADSMVLGAGGKAGNASVALAHLGATPVLLGCVGIDELGDLALRSLRQAGVDVSRVRRVPDAPTGLATVLVLGDGENAIVTQLGANLRLRPQDVPPLDGCCGLLLTLGVPRAALLRAVAEAGRVAARVIVDATPLRELPLPAELTAVDLLSANRVEAGQLLGRTVTGIDAARAACEGLHALGAANVVLKLGSEGAVWSDGTTAGHVAAPEVRVVDPTGAGDAFMAALAATWLGGSDLAQATRRACEIGGRVTAARGAQGAWT